jgi:hypothetical protein
MLIYMKTKQQRLAAERAQATVDLADIKALCALIAHQGGECGNLAHVKARLLEIAMGPYLQPDGWEDQAQVDALRAAREMAKEAAQ